MIADIALILSISACALIFMVTTILLLALSVGCVLGKNPGADHE